jgi:uncharacterized protein
MALLDEHLEIKESQIPGAGKGLFTKVDIPKGTRITEYKGKVMTWNDVKKDTEDHVGYVFWFNNQYVIDAWQTTKGVAHYANDARGITKVKGLTNNSDYETEELRCYIVATKDIPAGSEILVAYGADYWKVIRYNMKLKKEQEKKATKKK